MQTLDYDRLDQIASERRAEFLSAEPFQHVVIDDFLPKEAADALLEEFDETTESWKHYYHYNERKLAITDAEKMGKRTRALINALQSERFLSILTRLSGIEDLLADPELDGAGLHLIPPGGFLNIHTDFLSHTTNRTWSRQLNLLIFLNRGWRDEWRGDLELWDSEMTRQVRSVAPIFNRCVLFHTVPGSYHGHPHPLRCPEESGGRKSLALYYFRDEGVQQGLEPTRYRALPSASWLERSLVAADRQVVRAYSVLKRYAGLRDGLASRLLKRL